jgi:hypothetical protein
LSKGAWVKVEENKGGIEVENPIASTNQEISNARIKEALIKNQLSS